MAAGSRWFTGREDRTKLRRREERLEEGRVALAEPSHTVAAHDAELAQADESRPTRSASSA